MLFDLLHVLCASLKITSQWTHWSWQKMTETTWLMKAKFRSDYPWFLYEAKVKHCGGALNLFALSSTNFFIPNHLILVFWCVVLLYIFSALTFVCVWESNHKLQIDKGTLSTPNDLRSFSFCQANKLEMSIMFFSRGICDHFSHSLTEWEDPFWILYWGNR